MDAIAVTYLQTLGEIGAKIEKITANFDETSRKYVDTPNKTVNDLRQAKARYKLLCNDLRTQEKVLSTLNPPKELTKLHTDLLNTIRNYNKSVNQTADSINERTGQIDTSQLKQGKSGQQQYAQEVDVIANEIVKKMTK